MKLYTINQGTFTHPPPKSVLQSNLFCSRHSLKPQRDFSQYFHKLRGHYLLCRLLCLHLHSSNNHHCYSNIHLFACLSLQNNKYEGSGCYEGETNKQSMKAICHLKYDFTRTKAKSWLCLLLKPCTYSLQNWGLV